MTRAKIFSSSAVSLYAILLPSLWAGLSGPLSVRTVERQADVVAVATIEDVAAETKATVRIRLRIASVIRGETAPLVLTAELTPSPMMSRYALSPQDLVPRSIIGATGIWFLKERDGTFQVLPLATGDFTGNEMFLQLRSTEVPPPDAVIPGLAESGDRIHQRLLAALMDSYLSTPSPAGSLRDIMAASLDGEDLQDSLAAARVLIASSAADHQILGLWTMLRLGADDALALLAEKAPALQSHRMFSFLGFVLSTQYMPNGEASIGPLRQLASLHLGSADFDAAVASALRKIGTKAIVPAMVEFLDSQDPTAQLHAARFLSEYAMFADAEGNIPVLKPGEGRKFGPWRTDAALEYSPSRDSPKTAQEYAAYWKSWWAANRANLGFTIP
ncbi:MAG: hypothetical protein ACE141_11575 [Bryobacteraceae bacterium]